MGAGHIDASASDTLQIGAERKHRARYIPATSRDRCGVDATSLALLPPRLAVSAAANSVPGLFADPASGGQATGRTAAPDGSTRMLRAFARVTGGVTYCKNRLRDVQGKCPSDDSRAMTLSCGRSTSLHANGIAGPTLVANRCRPVQHPWEAVLQRSAPMELRCLGGGCRRLFRLPCSCAGCAETAMRGAGSFKPSLLKPTCASRTCMIWNRTAG